MNTGNILIFPAAERSILRRDLRAYGEALRLRGAPAERVDLLLHRIEPLLELLYAPLPLDALALPSDVPGLHQAVTEGLQKILVVRFQEIAKERLHREADLLAVED